MTLHRSAPDSSSHRTRHKSPSVLFVFRIAMHLLGAAPTALLLSFAAVGHAFFDPNPDQYCFTGCQTAVGTFALNFAGSPNLTDPYPMQQCFNDLFVQSVFVCARLYCPESQIGTGAWYADSQCDYGSIYNDTTRQIVDSISDADLATIPRLDYGYTSLDTVNTTIAPSQDMFDLGDRTITVWYDTRVSHLWYCYAMCLFWAGIVFIGVCNNLLSHISNILVTRSPSKTSHKSGPASSIWKWLQGYILLPATFNLRCSVPVWQCTLPPRAESMVIVAFIILNVVLCAVSYVIFPRNLYWDDQPLQIWRYFSDRTGYLSYANLAICWLFAIRNNVLLWLTGWNFATFNRFHRWVARLATLEAVLHSIGYTVFAFRSGGLDEYAEDFVEEYWYTGVIATITMSLMMGFSILYLRVKVYDFFLLLHIALSLITLVNLFYHTKIFEGQFDGWLWACVAFWVFDRALRIARVLFMVVLRRGFKAPAELDNDAGLIRVDVTEYCKRTKLTQSGYYFLYSPFALFAWENHPFTLVKYRQALTGPDMPNTPNTADANSEEWDGKATTAVSAAPVETRAADGHAAESEDRFVLLVRPYGGYTRYLRRCLMRAQGPQRMPFLLEGPYGDSPLLGGMSDVWFFIGGSGISIAVSSIYDVLEQSPGANIRLVWSSRSPRMVDTVLERELAAALRHDNFTVDAFITGDRVDLRTRDRCRSVEYYRPNVPALMRSAAQASKDHLAVVVCGPGSMTDDVRASFCTELRASEAKMSLFVESFNW